MRVAWFILVVFLLASCATTLKITPPPDYVGTWTGTGEHDLISSYLEKRMIPFTITITPDGTITGKIGDATLVDGTFDQCSDMYCLFSSGEFQASFGLKGHIVKREKFRRDSGRLYFYGIEGDKLRCMFKSEGDQSGRDISMNVRDLILKKQT